MVDRLPVGPYKIVRGANDASIPWYILPFDRNGRCTGPRTADAALKQAADGAFTDVVVFSHGWNNGWQQATDRYQNFVSGYLDQLVHHPPLGGVRSALLIGLFWPSKLLAGTADRAPEAAATPTFAEVDDERAEVDELGALLDDSAADRFYELTQKDALTRAQAAELVSMFTSLDADDQDESGADGTFDPADIAAAWADDPDIQIAPLDDLDELGFHTAPASGEGGPEAAAFLDALDPRQVVRAVSVWQMKHRAGTVGSRGVSALLSGLAEAGPRVHLVGHSFGAKVLLTALCAPPTVQKVRSVLLLQPAVSHLCFADKVGKSGPPGGFRKALDRVELPILSTFSSHDVALSHLYKLAMRRRREVGELQFAGRMEPSRYSALGGVGPHPAGGRIGGELEALDPGGSYPLDGAAPDVYGVDAGRTIKDHGDVSNESTWWMLSQLMHQR